jgi:DNA-binding LytR/AlgR family response regulator
LVCKETRLVTLESLKNLEEILPPDNFLRVHKSFIVAKNKVQRLEGNMLGIGQHTIPISRSKKEEIVEWIFFE